MHSSDNSFSFWKIHYWIFSLTDVLAWPSASLCTLQPRGLSPVSCFEGLQRLVGQAAVLESLCLRHVHPVLPERAYPDHNCLCPKKGFLFEHATFLRHNLSCCLIHAVGLLGSDLLHNENQPRRKAIQMESEFSNNKNVFLNECVHLSQAKFAKTRKGGKSKAQD